MITYAYECSNCEHTLEVRQKVDDKPLKRCPKCRKHKLFKVVTGGCYSFVYGEPTTVQHQADRNTRAMGSYEHQARIEADKASERDKQRAKRQALEESGVLPPGAKIPDPEKVEKPWYGEMPKDKKDKITKESNPDQKVKKMKDYIMEGK